jgi:hypothetical protein
MSAKRYGEYMTNIKAFLNSSEIDKYKSENSADFFVKKILSL